MQLPTLFGLTLGEIALAGIVVAIILTLLSILSG